ncbi:MAG TPA: protease inhibitor I9 family protein, partial [Longimicrobium sp.]|nr:protease inhibitor I9 family protein [Longimicrobium sp.]
MVSRRLYLAAAAVLALGVGACADQATVPTAATTDPGAALSAGEAIPNRYVIVFTDTVSDAPGLARRLASAHGGTVHYTYRHTIKGFAATLPAAAVEALRRNPRVAYVQPDQRVSAIQTTQYPATWGLDRVDQ